MVAILIGILRNSGIALMKHLLMLPD